MGLSKDDCPQGFSEFNASLSTGADNLYFTICDWNWSVEWEYQILKIDCGKF